MAVVEIEGFEGQYAVTETGNVWSYKTSKWLSIRGSGKIGVNKIVRDYKTIALWEKGFGYRYYYIHRLVARAFLPNPNNLPQINHKNGIKNDNRVENLEWCTREFNNQHAFKNGFTTRGEKNSHVKLSPNDVLKIRELYSLGGISQSKLAKQFNVSQSNIWMIIKRKNWYYI